MYGVNMSYTKLIDKVNALAKVGIGGEKENAKAKLKELMQKYNVTEEDLQSITPAPQPNITIPKQYFFNLTEEIAEKLKIN